MPHRPTRRRIRSGTYARALAGLLSFALAGSTAAQTDYYNTDAGRPVQIEDAYPTERHAFELQLAPLRLERAPGGLYRWEVEPELAYGILPRTQVEVSLPLAYLDADALGQRLGVAGLEASVLHNLNVETRTLPALGVAVEVHVPVGRFAGDRPTVSAKGLLTRTYRFARFHVNGLYTFGPAADAPADEHGQAELSRWLAGLAVDRVLPLRSMLLIGEVYAAQPLQKDADLAWNAGAGLRYQLSPRLAMDFGVGRQLTGDDPSWFVTIGSAYAFAVRSLIPVR